MTANPNSVWGCQAREFIKSIARSASGDDAERDAAVGRRGASLLRHPRPSAIEGVTHAHLSGRATPPADLPSPSGPQAAPHQQQRQEQR